MGTRGPAPARSDERRRANEPDTPITKYDVDKLSSLPFPIDLAPEPPSPTELAAREADDGWHPYATYLWEQLQRDPSRAWTGPAAMAVDLAMCENLSRLLMPRVAATIQPSEQGPGEVVYERLPLNGSEMAALMKWAAARGLYEADRLRIGKEVTFYSISDAVPQAATGTDDAAVISIKRNRREALAGRTETSHA